MNEDFKILDERLYMLGEQLTDQPSVVDDVMLQVHRTELIEKSASNPRRILAMLRKPRYAAAASVLAIVALGFGSWSTNHDEGSVAWWLSPPSAWADELRAEIERTRLEGYTCEECLVSFGLSAESRNSKFFAAGNRYRRDLYDEDEVRERQWYVVDDDGLTMTSVRYDDQTYRITHDPQVPLEDNPNTVMESLAQRLTEAGKSLGTEQLEGHDVVVFEIDSQELNDRSDPGTTTVCLDLTTKRPVMIMHVVGEIMITAEDFDWGPELPAETFEPKIPENFARVESE